MESLSEHFRDPLSAALIAGLITAGYIHLKAHLNNEGKLELNKYTKLRREKKKILQTKYQMIFCL